MRSWSSFVAITCCCYGAFAGTFDHAIATSSDGIDQCTAQSVEPTMCVDRTVFDRKPSRHVLVVGDSQACAVGAIMQRVVEGVDRANNRLIDTFDVDCRPGTTIEYWTLNDRFATSLRSHSNVDDVIVFLGTNDYYAVQAPNVDQILDVVRSYHIGCVWVGNTSVHGRTWPINSMLHDIVMPACVYVSIDDASVQLADGVHPTTHGAEIVLGRAWQALND